MIRRVIYAAGLLLASCEQRVATQASTPAVEANAPRQFDLHCVGVRQSDGRKWDDPINYRLDLDKMSYCNGECKRIDPIARIEVGTIYLYEPSLGGGEGMTVKVDRTTGEIIEHFTFGSVDEDSYNGKCERAPFSGFPPQKF